MNRPGRAHRFASLAATLLLAMGLLLQAGCSTAPATPMAMSATAPMRDGTPRIAVISATTQLALDHFRVTHVVVSGIAGGVNPALHIGDVTVAQRWAQYLEVVAAREVAPGRYQLPPWVKDATLPNFGSFYPRPVEVRSDRQAGVERRMWFEADPALLAIARRIEGQPLARCDAQAHCLASAPRVVVGGNGVSGEAFVDNAALREHAFRIFEANVLDMETAAMAHVAYANHLPFIAFRSLSDLAGGGPGENEMGTFLTIAADNSAHVLLAFLDAWK